MSCSAGNPATNTQLASRDTNTLRATIAYAGSVGEICATAIPSAFLSILNLGAVGETLETNPPTA
jgi:hypothetical protein